jgi:hypothetical protein
MSNINIYVVYPEAVDVRSFKGAESWWGGSLAWVAHSLGWLTRLGGTVAHSLSIYVI